MRNPPRLLVVGLSHKTAPVQMREKAALGPARTPPLLAGLRGDGVRECAALSTCNRTELYAVVDEAAAGERLLERALVEHTRLDWPALRSSAYAERDEQAARHLFRVSAGLESMVLGESQIQGQVRAAAVTAAALGTSGPLLKRLFRQATQAGRRVRRETAIGTGAVSIPSIAVAIACRAFPRLSGRSALLLGAGEMAESTARALLGRGLSALVVANRTPAAATSLAERFGGRGVPLSALPDELTRADVVIASTDSPGPLLTRAQVEPAAGARRRPLVIVDIAVPRDVDPAIAEIPGVTLYDIDDLERLADTNLHVRRREALQAERIVEEETHRFGAWRQAHAAAPALRRPGAQGAAVLLSPR